MNDPKAGEFYLFYRDRPNRELGRRIPRWQAVVKVRQKQDVYTLLQSEALSLAKDARKGKAEADGAHAPKKGDWDYGLPRSRRFRHFHPGSDHDAFGHVFYGPRGAKGGSRG